MHNIHTFSVTLVLQLKQKLISRQQAVEEAINLD